MIDNARDEVSWCGFMFALRIVLGSSSALCGCRQLDLTCHFIFPQFFLGTHDINYHDKTCSEVDPAKESAWVNLITSEIHRRREHQAREPIIALPVNLKVLLKHHLGISRCALVRSAQAAAAQILTSTEAHVDWTPHQELICSTLHAAYEDCKLSTLTWMHLQPLGIFLSALFSNIPDSFSSAFSQHYAQDFGLVCKGQHDDG